MGKRTENLGLLRFGSARLSVLSSHLNASVRSKIKSLGDALQIFYGQQSYGLGALPQSSPTDAVTDHCHGIGKPIKGLIINVTALQSSVSKC